MAMNNGGDMWLEELETSETLVSEIARLLSDRDSSSVGSDRYNTLSASIRIHLKQLTLQLQQLNDSLEYLPNLTFEERERRQRIIEQLNSRNVHMAKLFKTSPDTRNRSQLLGSDEPTWADDEDVPLLGSEKSVDALKEQHRRLLSDQDKGLENLSNIIARQKNISIAIHNEVDLHNTLIDDIGNRMDSTSSNIRRETTAVDDVSQSDSTFVYWIVIIVLLVCIIGVGLG